MEYHAVGLMSGSSLDGLDMAFCRFQLAPGADPLVAEWSILDSQSVPFSTDWQERLRELPGAGAAELAGTHAAFGRYMGSLLRPFLDELSPAPDLIASHGHTIFHYPDRQFTFQLGDGAALAAVTGQRVVSDFRTLDIALGGQGAPLAPLADRHLLPGYDFYLNLGGIANISARTREGFVAFDIGGANQVLNALVDPLGLPYDEGGRLAARGQLNNVLLKSLDTLFYFSQPYPKSLGNDWVQERLLTRFRRSEAGVEDKLHTACVQLARQIARAVQAIRGREKIAPPPYRMLITGGGAFNHFLTDCIRRECEKVCSFTVEVPEDTLISFKEAALIALMGALRLENIPNCLASVTGARHDSSGGCIYQG